MSSTDAQAIVHAIHGLEFVLVCCVVALIITIMFVGITRR